MKLDQRKRSAAIKQVKGMKLALTKIYDQFGPRYEDPSDEAAIKLFKGPYFKHLSPGVELIDLECVRGIEDPEEFVDEFIHFWDEPCGRDVSCRTFCTKPGGGQKTLVKIVFAGDMSWGDEPEGYGYTTLKTSDMAGLHDIFKLM